MAKRKMKLTALFMIEANQSEEKDDGSWKTLKTRGFQNTYGESVPVDGADIYYSEREAKRVLNGCWGDAKDPRFKAAKPKIVKFVRK